MSAARKIRIDTVEDAHAVLAEVLRVCEVPAPVFYDPNFPQQAAFLRDSAKFKAGQCPRRAGKSRGIGMWLLEPVMEEEDVTTLYIAKTRDSAKRIMWRDVFKAIGREKGLELKANESALTLTNPVTNSHVQLVGGDASPDEFTKFLGSKLRRVAIDESADFRQDLERLVYEILWPALADHEGELALIGTAGPVAKGLFFDVTNGRRSGWSVHKWSALDNPYMREKILKQIEELKVHNPRIEETPWFRRSYLNEWAKDESLLCYRYAEGRNDLAELPDAPGRRINVLGIDLGFTDATAFTMASFSTGSRDCHFVDFYKKSGMTITDVAERLDYYQRAYHPHAMVVDGAAKQAVEELRQRFGFDLIAADKAGKAEMIEIMNSEFLAGRVKLLMPVCAELVTEYEDLIWDEKALPKRVEHPACENHGADSALYAFRHCWNYLSKPPAKRDERTPSQRAAAEVEAIEEREAELVHRARAKPFWER